MSRLIAARLRPPRLGRGRLATWLCLLGALLGLSACERESYSAAAAAPQPYVTALPYGALAPEDLKLMMDAGEVFDLVDVRSVQEYLAGHLPGATSIPYAQLAARYRELNPRTPTVIYCRTGSTCILACQTLARLGFSNLYYFNAAVNQWEYGLELGDGRLIV